MATNHTSPLRPLTRSTEGMPSLDKTEVAAPAVDDKLTWIQVSNLKFWDSGPAAKYRVSSIPYSILIDTEGKVISKGLQPEELGGKLTQLLK